MLMTRRPRTSMVSPCGEERGRSSLKSPASLMALSSFWRCCLNCEYMVPLQHQHHLDCLLRPLHQEGKPLFEFIKGEFMRDDRRDIQPLLGEEVMHPVPGIKEEAGIN